jgi:hypothetical protein
MLSSNIFVHVFLGLRLGPLPSKFMYFHVPLFTQSSSPNLFTCPNHLNQFLLHTSTIDSTPILTLKFCAWNLVSMTHHISILSFSYLFFPAETNVPLLEATFHYHMKMVLPIHFLPKIPKSYRKLSESREMLMESRKYAH